MVPTRTDEFDSWYNDGTRTLRVLDEHLSTQRYMVADSLSIADLALYSYVHRAEEGGFDLTRCSGLRHWFDRIEERPRHIAIDTVPTGTRAVATWEGGTYTALLEPWE